MATFVDRVVLTVRAGNGGHGCASIRREKFKPLAGPDGANGGNGGDVILEVNPNVTTLLAYHHSPRRTATNGAPGSGDMRQGKNGEDLVLEVPLGTTVKDKKGRVLCDLVQSGQRFTAAKGGLGGLGNAALASPKRKAPGFALLGEDGEEKELVLELKSMADVALVGYPSAGKSSLVAAVSAAKPKIADYPFTTLTPNLGVVQAGNERYTIADVPGLIPGASEGKGLGLDFLRHIERCAVIAHVIDCATFESDRDPLSDLQQLELELGNYAAGLDALASGSGQDGADQDEDAEEAAEEARTIGQPRWAKPVSGLVPLMERPRVIILNKMDVPDAREMAEMMRPQLEETGWPIFEISTVARTGLKELVFALAKVVLEARAVENEAREEETSQQIIIRPKARDAAEFTVKYVETKTDTYFQVRGIKPERWIKQTDFNNDEAVGYLADRLEKLGVEEALYKAGATPGSMVVIGPRDGGYIFDWEPTISTGAELLGPRGTDLRLEDRSRATRAEKRQAFHDLMDARSAAREELWTERTSGQWTDPSADPGSGQDAN